jgi:hypothetical protein
MPQYVAIAVATAFALVAFLPLAGRSVLRPLLWLTLIACTAVGFIVRDGTQVVLDLLRPYFDMAADPSGAVVSTLIAAAVGELLKATPALIAISLGSADDVTGLAFGAAAGAAFGAFVRWPLLAFPIAMIMSGSSLTSPFFAGVAIFGGFFWILAHVVTTAYVGRAGVSGGLGRALFFAVFIQFVLGLAERMRVVASIPTGVVVTAVISVAMFSYLWSLRSRALAAAES